MTADWKKLWNYLSVDLTSGKDGDIEIDVTPEELREVEKFGQLIAKFNPPEDDRIPLDARKDNDRKFREFMAGRFKRYQHIKRIEP